MKKLSHQFNFQNAVVPVGFNEKCCTGNLHCAEGTLRVPVPESRTRKQEMQ